MRHAALARWAPLLATLVFVAALLLRAGTAPLDLIRYALYAGLAVILPGTLLYRLLRGRAQHREERGGRGSGEKTTHDEQAPSFRLAQPLSYHESRG